MFWNTRRRSFGPRRRQHGRSAPRFLESLESRRLLSTATADTIIIPSATVIATSSVTNPSPPSGAITPSQLAQLYSINPSSSSGAGLTIAIVDAYNDPNIRQDLAVFNAQYGLPAANLTVVNEFGGSSLPSTDAGWSLEIAMDVEWAHVAAPGANIVLVEANSASLNDLFQAVKTASGLSNVVSMSWGSSEFQGQAAYDSMFNKPFVTFVAASGDDGGASGVEWPASSPYVVGVGGTTLSGSAETAWSAVSSRRSGYSGSTGGTSGVVALPAYQAVALGGSYASGRATPDVSSLGNPNTGVAVYDSVAGDGSTGWAQVGGTSAGAPVWAGIIASADQARWNTGRKTLGSYEVLSLLYGLAESNGSKTSTYSSYFHDVTSGYNFNASAGVGYDQVTGLGSPVASNIVSAASHFGLTWAQIVSGATRSAVVVSGAVASTTLTAHAAVATASVGQSTVAATTTQAIVVVAPASVPPLQAVAAPSMASTADASQSPLASSAPTRPIQPASEPVRLSGLSSLDDDAAPRPAPMIRSRPGILLDPVESKGVGDLEPMLSVLPPLPGPIIDFGAALDQTLSRGDSLGFNWTTERGEADSSPSAAAVAGLAFAIWGTWEYRSRSPRRRKVAVWK